MYILIRSIYIKTLNAHVGLGARSNLITKVQASEFKLSSRLNREHFEFI